MNLPPMFKPFIHRWRTAALAILAASALTLNACRQTAPTQIPLPTAKVPSLNEVNSAIELWESSGNEDYFITVEETDQTGSHLYRVVVVAGEIQAAQRLEKIEGTWQQPSTIDPQTAREYTVDALLSRVLRDVSGEGPAPVNMFAVFDQISGFPTLVDAKAIPSYTEDGRIRLNREFSYVLTVMVDALLEDTFGLTKTPVLTLSRSGGEQAACSTLRIFTDGTSIYSDNCRQVLLQLRPPADTFNRLESLAQDYGEFIQERTISSETQELILHGNGAGTIEPAEVEDIWDLAVSLNELLSRPIGQGITLLVKQDSSMVGFDMRTNLEQPASLDISPPLHGGLVDAAGKRLIYSDSAALKWLDTASGESGTYLSNRPDRWVEPMVITVEGRVVLRRFSSGTDAVEWGWVSQDDRSWHPLPQVVSCISAIDASPIDETLAIATYVGAECSRTAGIWTLDLIDEISTPAAQAFSQVEAVKWSPDGSWLAFAGSGEVPSGENVHSALFLMRPDGSDLTPLSQNEAGFVTGIVWNPVNDSLVYGLQDVGAGDPAGGLHVIDPAGGGTIRTLPGDSLTPHGFDPTGDFLAFSDGSDLLVWVVPFGRVLPVLEGGAAGSFVGFIAGGDR